MILHIVSILELHHYLCFIVDSVSMKTETVFISAVVQTLLCSLFVVVLVTVVLAVIYLDHLNNCYVM